jgi:hypothetical protein
MERETNVTRWLLEWTEGNQAALERLLPLVYDELRRLAGYQLQRERRAHTLQATALDECSLIIYTMMTSSILYLQRNTTGAALISSTY